MKFSNNNKDIPFFVGGTVLSDRLLNIASDLCCPKCGLAASGNNFFSIECKNQDMIIDCTFSNKINKWVISNCIYGNININKIKCLGCLFCGDKELFINSETNSNSFKVIIEKIGNKWTKLKYKNIKSFFIKTCNLPRKFNNKDICVVKGISINEIENNMQIDCDDIYIV